MKRSYYSGYFPDFVSECNDSIFGKLARAHEFALEDSQKNAWVFQIDLIKTKLSSLNNGYIIFEYSIPRMGKRVDNIFIYDGIIFVIEFKVGDKHYHRYAIDQVFDYALDLKYFHEQSHLSPIVPVLVCTEAEPIENEFKKYDDLLLNPILSNKNTLDSQFKNASLQFKSQKIDPHAWESSLYRPTPTIIEAAQALYKGHQVKEISRSDAEAINLSLTSDCICEIIDETKQRREKAICFITGVPGAGKTLAGLNIANQRHKEYENEHAVFLSGNGPLVLVLQEALARDQARTPSSNLSKREALKKTKAFIQNIHYFRDDAIQSNNPPLEKVVIFDEAQRAWTLEQTRSFMNRKKGIANFDKSEPQFLIEVMDRHTDWSVIICLVGGGQEINTGEAGLPEWFRTLGAHFGGWKI